MSSWESAWSTVEAVALAPTTLIVLTSVSLVCCVVSLVVATWAVRRLPADYLLHDPGAAQAVPCSRASLLLRNLFGGLLLVLGLLMLILPGQGLLTIIAGLAVMSFRSKRRLEQRLLARPHVLSLINRLRQRSGHPPLLPPASSQNHPGHTPGPEAREGASARPAPSKLSTDAH
jgi:hypothetical protein